MTVLRKFMQMPDIGTYDKNDFSIIAVTLSLCSQSLHTGCSKQDWILFGCGNTLLPLLLILHAGC